MATARGKKKNPSDTKRSNTEIDAAIAVVRSDPSSADAWTKLEEAGAASEQQALVASTYREVIAGHPEIAIDVGRRAVEYHDDWGEEQSAVAELVGKIFAAAPTETWAFDRLKLTFSSEERWLELLDLFDSALASAPDEATTASLLEDAARVAKDFARDFDRAISLSERLYAAKKDDRSRVALEKLYDKCQKHEKLIALYEAQVPGLPPEGAQALRGKIASLWLTVGDADRSFAVIEEMLAMNAEEPAAFELLERIFAVPSQ